MVVCIYTMEYYSATRKKAVLPLAVMWMNMEDIMLSDISHGGRGDCMISRICGLSKVKYVEAESRKVVTWAGKRGHGGMWVRGTKLQLCRMNKPTVLPHRVRTTVTDAPLNTGKGLRE